MEEVITISAEMLAVYMLTAVAAGALLVLIVTTIAGSGKSKTKHVEVPSSPTISDLVLARIKTVLDNRDMPADKVLAKIKEHIRGGELLSGEEI